MDHAQRYHPQHFLVYASDPVVFTRAFGAWVLWICGYSDQARQWGQEVLAVTAEGVTPFNRAAALVFTAAAYQHRREPLATQRCVEETIALAGEHGFPFWAGWSAVLYGWSRIAMSQPGTAPDHEALVQARQGLETFRATGAQLVQPYLLGTLSEAYMYPGRPQEGLRLPAEASSMAHKHAERLWEAELYRLQGECLLALSRKGLIPRIS